MGPRIQRVQFSAASACRAGASPGRIYGACVLASVGPASPVAIPALSPAHTQEGIFKFVAIVLNMPGALPLDACIGSSAA